MGEAGSGLAKKGRFLPKYSLAAWARMRGKVMAARRGWRRSKPARARQVMGRAEPLKEAVRAGSSARK